MRFCLKIVLPNERFVRIDILSVSKTILREVNMEKYEKITKYAPYLEPEAHVGEWRGGCDKNGNCYAPFIDYDSKIKEFINLFLSSEYADDNYTEVLEKQGWFNVGNLRNAVPSMSENEVLSCITAILRQERFCEGLIESRIKDGTLSMLVKRLGNND